MDFQYQNENCINLLGNNKKQLIIPRYQRDYSWTKTQADTLLNDVISAIKKNEQGQLEPAPYFFGTLLLKGDRAQKYTSLEIIDGQQRLTTIYILLVALKENINNIDSSSLTNSLKDDIDDNLFFKDETGSKKKTLLIETTNDFFIKYLFSSNVDRDNLPILDYTSLCIKNVFDYFKENLSEEYLCRKFNEHKYHMLLRKLYDQVGTLIVGTLTTQSDEEATSIFESLNSKGLPLLQSDLIKNKIFSQLREKEPLDKAKTSWSQIKENLESKNVLANNYPFTTLEDFVTTYWKTNISNSAVYKIYTAFSEKLNAKELTTTNFLEELCEYSSDYGIIYGNKTGYNFSENNWDEIDNYLNLLVKWLKIKQVYPVILQIMHCYKKGYLSEKVIVQTLKYTSNFHIIYNNLFQGKGNRLNYAKFARAIKNHINEYENQTIEKAQLTQKICDELAAMKTSLSEILPSESEIKSQLEEDNDLLYTNKPNTDNEEKLSHKCKSILINYTILVNKKYPTNMNIEHMLPDNKDDRKTWSIGNLLFLLKSDNTTLNDKPLEEKSKLYPSMAKTSQDLTNLLNHNFFNELCSNEKETALANRKNHILMTIYEYVNKKEKSSKQAPIENRG